MKRNRILTLIASVVLGAVAASAGQAVGGNLFAPIRSKVTYLMDNDGTVVHTWSSAYTPALSVYLLPDGTLLRPAATGGSAFDAGGAGGRVELLGWDSEVVWSFDYSSEEHRLHHDVEVLPNGNVLMIAWERKAGSEAIAAGREPSLLPDGELWPDHVIEVEPSGGSGGTVVWEWHVWDHLVQDYDPARPNYGGVGAHPELVDLNFTTRGVADWTHINSIDYNPELDQILLSVHGFSEIWVIDHSTTTAEAAGHSGGRCGRGGDLLYRWGNPRAYGAGSVADQKLFAQHDAEWIAGGLPGVGNILVFNNGQGRPEGSYSSVDEIVPPLLADGSYASALPFGPDAAVWSYVASPAGDFFADRISGAQRLVDGNTLICDGPAGRFFEVTGDGDTVWEYLAGGQVFRVERYETEEQAFSSWLQIAAHAEGENQSLWLTDVAVFNPGDSEIQVDLVLHLDGVETGMAVGVPALSQTVVEDLVGQLGIEGKGAVEIRASAPVSVFGRIYNDSGHGTYGQFVDATPAAEGLAAGTGIWLLGLRQLDGVFRSNLGVTNTGADVATVSVGLYATDGTLLHSYSLTVPARSVVQDLQPFALRAGRPSVGWGFARVEVESGSGILCSASVIDAVTNDATTILMGR